MKMNFKQEIFLSLFVSCVSSQGNCGDPASASCLSEAQYLIQNCGSPPSSAPDTWAKCACPGIYPLITDWYIFRKFIINSIKPDLCSDAALLLDYKPQIISICQSVFNTTHSPNVTTITSTISTNADSGTAPSASVKSDQTRTKKFCAIIAILINLIIL